MPKRKEPKAIIDEIRKNIARKERQGYADRISVQAESFQTEIQPRIEWVVARYQVGREPTYVIKFENSERLLECRPANAMAHARDDIRQFGARVLTRDLMDVLMQGQYPYNVSVRFTDQGMRFVRSVDDPGDARPPRIVLTDLLCISYEDDTSEYLTSTAEFIDRMRRDAFYYGPQSFGGRWLSNERPQQPIVRTMTYRRVRSDETTEGVSPREPGAKEFIESIQPKNRWENVDW